MSAGWSPWSSVSSTAPFGITLLPVKRSATSMSPSSSAWHGDGTAHVELLDLTELEAVELLRRVAEAQRTLEAFRRTTEHELVGHLDEIGQVLELVLLRRGLRDVEAVDVDRRCRLARDDARALERVLQRGIRLRRVTRRLTTEIGEHRALVLAVRVDVAVLQRLEDDLGRPDVVLGLHVDTVGGECLPVRLRQRLSAREVLRADDERFATTGERARRPSSSPMRRPAPLRRARARGGASLISS